MEILGISFDGVEANAAFARKFNFNFPLLCDPDRKVGLAYGAADEPGTGGYAKRISYLIGPDRKVKKAWPKVDAAAHPAAVLAEL